MWFARERKGYARKMSFKKRFPAYFPCHKRNLFSFRRNCFILWGMDEEETKLALARLNDLSRECEGKSYLTCSPFYGFSEQSALLEALRKQNKQEEINGVPYFLFGGEEESERKCFVFLPPYLAKEGFLQSERESPDVLCCLHIFPKSEKFASPLSHRDYLGALLSLGVERNRIGDILCGEKDAYAYVLNELADYLKENLISVGRNPVKCAKLPSFSCPYAPKFEERRISVASLRLDALLAGAFRISREEAKRQIDAGNVYLTSSSPKPDAVLKEGEHVSLRGKGKFVYLGEGGTSKKGKLIASIKLPK